MGRRIASLVALVVVMGPVVVACTAETTEEDPRARTTNLLEPGAAAGEWLFNDYCGTNATGGCGNDPACPDNKEPAVGTDCDAPLRARCVGPKPHDGGARKKYVCTPRAIQAWSFSGYCGGGAGDSCNPSHQRPACKENAPAGKACNNSGARCVNGKKIFACLPPAAATVWLLSAECGAKIEGDNVCVGVLECAVTPTAGAACTNDGETIASCRSRGDNARLFVCAAR